MCLISEIYFLLEILYNYVSIEKYNRVNIREKMTEHIPYGFITQGTLK